MWAVPHGGGGAGRGAPAEAVHHEWFATPSGVSCAPDLLRSGGIYCAVRDATVACAHRMNWMLVAIGCYLVAQVVIGLLVAPRIRTEDDFLLGGRRLGPVLTTFSLFATWFGAESVIASSARTAQQGISLTTAEPFGYGLCLIVAGLVFAGPLWRRRLTTLADLFRQRYSVGVERIAAAIMIPTSLLWAAAQLRGFAHVLTAVMPLDAGLAIGVAAAFCVAYTAFGGLLADAITDLVQGAVIIAGLVVLVVALLLMEGAGSQTPAMPPPVVAGAMRGEGALALLEEWAIPVFGSVLAAELVSRLIAARSPGVARNGALAAGAIYVAVGMLPLAVGLAGAGLVPHLEDNEQFLPVLARIALHPVLYVVFAGALISAILSTVDTVLLTASGLASHNLVAPLTGLTGERSRLVLTRSLVVVFGAVAWLLAAQGTGVGELVEQASALGSAGILVVACFGLFSRFGGQIAAKLSLLAATASYLGGAAAGAPYPFLTSVAVALAAYCLGALAEGRAAVAAAASGVPDRLEDGAD